MNSDGFTLVTKRRRAKATAVKSGVIELTSTSPQETVEDCIEKILKAKEELLNSGLEYFEANLKKVQSHLKSQIEDKPEISHIVCYGLGLPSCSWIARYQTGLLIVLRDFFNVKVEVYDPAFTDIDVEVLKRLHFAVIEENEEGKRKVTQPTIFYMPHCGKGLYNNLLWTNWHHECLSKCVIIGNSFSVIVQNIPARVIRKYYQYINLATGFFEEYPLKYIIKEENIFNDMSIHVVKSQGNTLNLDQNFWSAETEPQYECDAEFVRLKI